MRVNVNKALTAVTIVAGLTGCIKNDLPYPRIEQNITALAVEGQSRDAAIDSVAMMATVYLEETTDIKNVKFTEFQISEGGESDKNLLEGTWDMSSPIYLTLHRFQDYSWEVRAVQDIPRYFQVDGEVGESVVDPVAHRVIVHLPEGTDLSNLRLISAKLGPAGITQCIPALDPGKLDLSYPLRVEVTAWGRTEIWTIYAEISETIVSTTQVDAWSMVIWAYGAGPADVQNGFQYRKAGDTEWIDVPQTDVTQTQGSFSACIPHLTPLTDYEVRTVSGENFGNVVKATTQGTMDIPNGDFENWHQTSKKMWCPWALDGTSWWDSGNTGSITLGQNITEPSDDTPTGQGLSAKMMTKFVGLGPIGKLGAGSIFTGVFRRVDGTNGILDFGREWNLRPTKLKGYMKFHSEPINYSSGIVADYKGRPDSCQIYICLTDWENPYEVRTNPKNQQLFNPQDPAIIGYGQLTLGSDCDWRPFEIEIVYRNTHRVPKYIDIVAAASKFGDYFTGGTGTTLYIDQLSLSWDY